MLYLLRVQNLARYASTVVVSIRLPGQYFLVCVSVIGVSWRWSCTILATGGAALQATKHRRARLKGYAVGLLNLFGNAQQGETSEFAGFCVLKAKEHFGVDFSGGAGH